jgi:hypothetical protein
LFDSESESGIILVYHVVLVVILGNFKL